MSAAPTPLHRNRDFLLLWGGMAVSTLGEARERAAVMLGTPLGGALFGVGRAVPFLIDWRRR